jgi:phage protein D
MTAKARCDFVVGAPGPLPPNLADLPVHLVVEDGDRLPAAATLRYWDPDRVFLRDSGIAIGKPLKVTARLGGKTVPVFTGEVVALEADFDATGSFTTVRALDLAHRLQRGRRVAAYPNTTAADVAEKLAKQAHIPIGVIEPTRTTYTLLTQPNLADWDFLLALGAQNGLVPRVVDGRFHFDRPDPASTAPPADVPMGGSPYLLSMFDGVLSVRTHLSSVNYADQVQVRGWNVAEKRAVLGRSAVTHDSGAKAGLTPSSVASAPFGSHTWSVTDVTHGSEAEAQAVAAALAEGVASAFAALEIVVQGDPHLRAGCAVTLTGAGKPFDGHYTVTGARHRVGPGQGYETRLTVGARGARAAAGPSGHGSGGDCGCDGSSGGLRGARVPGVAVAVVTDTKEPEQHRGSGWVRLRFPWLSGDPGAESGAAYVSDWVRTVQLGGTGGGGVFSPEVGDEVLVSFDQGRLDRPYVIGGLYNGVDKPSSHDGPLVDETSGKVARRSLVSRAGDRLELLSAESGPSGVRLRTGDGKLTLHLDRQKTEITVHSDGTVNVSATQAVTVKGNGVTLDAGDGALTLSGNSVSLSGANVSVEGRSQCAVKAPMVKIN